jgi:hypothetical protein
LYGFNLLVLFSLGKYPLLLKELTKNISVEDPQHSILLTAHEKLNAVVNCINDRKREAENMAKVLEIKDSLEGIDDVGEREFTKLTI